MNQPTKAQQLAGLLMTEKNAMPRRIDYYSAVAIARELRRLDALESQVKQAAAASAFLKAVLP